MVEVNSRCFVIHAMSNTCKSNSYVSLLLLFSKNLKRKKWDYKNDGHVRYCTPKERVKNLSSIHILQLMPNYWWSRSKFSKTSKAKNGQ